MKNCSANQSRHPVGYGARIAVSSAVLLLFVPGILLVPTEAKELSALPDPVSRMVDYEREIQPLLERRCYECHGATRQRADLRLDFQATVWQGGAHGPALIPGDSKGSLLIQAVAGLLDDIIMPPGGEPLTRAEIALLRGWIDQGAAWPEEPDAPSLSDADWWSLHPLRRPALPALDPAHRQWVRTPVDSFVLAKLREHGLAPSPEADRGVLIRRVHFNLIGLPPPPEEVARFVNDPDPRAYEKMVERLLASPHYGERWARHWLDIAQYGDSHGFDKDQPRPHAWPYRDYVIRAMNADKPYSRFIQEQVAGDVLFPGTPDGIVATGFIAAGAWDSIAHLEVPETKLDGQIARHLDRDDMVGAVMNTFTSMTVQCAQCHAHKFDPITQEDYYSLQAVFAALDRADRPFDPDPDVAELRRVIETESGVTAERKARLDERIADAGGAELAAIDQRLGTLEQAGSGRRPEFGYHSAIEASDDVVKWVQVDLGEPVHIDKLVLIGCHDDFNNIGAGFGFPVRFKIEVSNDPEFNSGARLVLDQTRADLTNPLTEPQTVQVNGKSARYVRVTATKLAPRQNDFIFALAELSVFDETGRNAAWGATVSALDSVEAPPRWQKKNLVDGYYPGVKAEDHSGDLAALREERQSLIDRVAGESLRKELAELEAALADLTARLKGLPQPHLVYAGTVHHGSGNFRGTGPDGGRPRAIHVLARGDVRNPREPVGPGTLSVFPELPARFDLPPGHGEGDRRAALAEWLTAPENALVWRSIVNRIWLYHFGRGIVDSPNDFGRMGRLPTHPELLDWLAVEFRDDGQSLKQLHRLIVNSATYRQSSRWDSEKAKIDSDNQFYWRMDRRRLEAEAIRDAVLSVSGKLNPAMFGPGFQDFVIEKPEHSPHYQYHLHDPEDARSHRRAIYRFLVRSQPDPYMMALDCADPSMQVEKRDETLTALQALALLNNQLMISMSGHFAARLEAWDGSIEDQMERAWWLAMSRAPDPDEVDGLAAYAREHGLANACRLIFNLNEFIFID